MNKTITLYDLLGLIKDGKAPKKIKYDNAIYNLSQNKEVWVDRLYRKEENSDVSLSFDYIGSLNSEVEILEEEDEFIEIEPEEYCKITDETISGLKKSLNVILNEQNNQINQLIHNQKILIEKMKEK